MMIYMLCICLFCLGLYGILIKKNVIKIIIGLLIMEYSLNLLLVMIGFVKNASEPIVERGALIQYMVDPLPQAAVLLLMIVNFGVTAVAAAIAIRIYEKYGTFDITKVRRLKG